MDLKKSFILTVLFALASLAIKKNAAVAAGSSSNVAAEINQNMLKTTSKPK